MLNFIEKVNLSNFHIEKTSFRLFHFNQLRIRAKFDRNKSTDSIEIRLKLQITIIKIFQPPPTTDSLNLMTIICVGKTVIWSNRFRIGDFAFSNSNRLLINRALTLETDWNRSEPDH